MSVLTKRDLSLFRWLAKYGLLATTQISTHLFPGVQNSTVLRRLRALEEEKWIYRIKALESGELVWLLGAKGESKAGVENSMIRPNRNSLAHDVQLTDLRIRLGEIGIGQNFIPEWVLKRKTFDPNRRRSGENSIVPDGLFSAVLWNKSVKTVALELEINPKSIQRYDKIFAKYMGQRNLDLIWYFVKTKTYGDALFRKWRQVQRKRFNKDENIYFTVLSDFEANPWKAKIYYLSGGSSPIDAFYEAQPVPTRWAGEKPKTEQAQELKSAS